MSCGACQEPGTWSITCCGPSTLIRSWIRRKGGTPSQAPRYGMQVSQKNSFIHCTTSTHPAGCGPMPNVVVRWPLTYHTVCMLQSQGPPGHDLASKAPWWTGDRSSSTCDTCNEYSAKGEHHYRLLHQSRKNIFSILHFTWFSPLSSYAPFLSHLSQNFIVVIRAIIPPNFWLFRPGLF